MRIKPSIVVWEYTLACNSHCIHCGSDANRPRPDELTTDEALDLVDQILETGFKRVVLSGGEPTLRADWPIVAYAIKNRGMELGILSNALAWSKDTIEQLVAIKPWAIGLSVDGEPAMHDYLRGVPGSHGKVFHAIDELKRCGMTVSANTAVNTKNIDDLPAIADRLASHKVDGWMIMVTSPMGRFAQHKDLVLNEDQYYKLAEFIADARKKMPAMNIQPSHCIGYYGTLEARLRDSEWSGCKAGIIGIGIEANGAVKGCLSLQSPDAYEGNIRVTPLRRIWADPQKFKYIRRFTAEDTKKECTGCERAAQCGGGCQSMALSHFGEFHAAPYCLRRYELRKVDEHATGGS